MSEFSLPGFDIDAFVRATLDEDLGVGLPGGGRDVTAESVIPADARFSGVMDSRDAIVVAGLPIAAAFFRALDPEIEIELLAEEGEEVAAGAGLMRLAGNARAMLTAERSALNTLQHLCGIATLTRQYVRAMGETQAVLLDTRKTVPGLRALQNYAVRVGGAVLELVELGGVPDVGGGPRLVGQGQMRTSPLGVCSWTATMPGVPLGATHSTFTSSSGASTVSPSHSLTRCGSPAISRQASE